MSESDKRTPISIYLTPKAAMVLREYSIGSGYGSLSRTVEEIILAFDATYKIVKGDYPKIFLNQFANKTTFTDAEKNTAFMLPHLILQNINNAVSRLQPTTESAQGT